MPSKGVIIVVIGVVAVLLLGVSVWMLHGYSTKFPWLFSQQKVDVGDQAQKARPTCSGTFKGGNQSGKGPQKAGDPGFNACAGECGPFTYTSPNPILPQGFVTGAWYNADNKSVPTELMHKQLDFVYMASYNGTFTGECATPTSLRNPDTRTNLAAQVDTLRSDATVKVKYILISIGGSSFGDFSDYSLPKDCSRDYPLPPAPPNKKCNSIANMYYNGTTQCLTSGTQFKNEDYSEYWCCCSSDYMFNKTKQTCDYVYQPMCGQNSYWAKACSAMTPPIVSTAAAFEMLEGYCDNAKAYGDPHLCQCNDNLLYDPILRICCSSADAAIDIDTGNLSCYKFAQKSLNCPTPPAKGEKYPPGWDVQTRVCCSDADKKANGGWCPIVPPSGQCVDDDKSLVEAWANVLADTGADGFDIDYEISQVDGEWAFGLVSFCKSFKQYCFDHGVAPSDMKNPTGNVQGQIPKYPILNITLVAGPTDVQFFWPIFWSINNDPLCPFDYCIPMTYSNPQYGFFYPNPLGNDDYTAIPNKYMSSSCSVVKQLVKANDYKWNILVNDFIACYMASETVSPCRLLPAFIFENNQVDFTEEDAYLFNDIYLKGQLSPPPKKAPQVQIAGAVFFWYVTEGYNLQLMEKVIDIANDFKQKNKPYWQT